MNKIFIVFHCDGDEGSGWWENVCKVFTDETTAEVFALEMNELRDEYLKLNFQSDSAKELLKKYMTIMGSQSYISSSMEFTVKSYEVN